MKRHIIAAFARVEHDIHTPFTALTASLAVRCFRRHPSQSIASGLMAAFALTFAVFFIAAAPGPAIAASDLRLSPGLSFDDDSSPNFPIQGNNLSDGSIATGQPTVVFFGTANCWNTAREAERLIKLYPQFRGRMHFVIVNLRALAPAQKMLVARYYHGYIPTITLIASDGKVIYDRAGETAARRGDTSKLQRLLDSAR